MRDFLNLFSLTVSDMLRCMLLVLSVWVTSTHFILADTIKTNIEVLAVEYPPFTSNELNDNGVNFRLLKERIGEHYTISPLFLPPARAQQTVLGDDWCLSFYPRQKGAAGSRQFRLSDSPVVLTLAHRKQHTPAQWQSLDQLAPQSVAVLRAKAESPFLKQFNDAGIKLVYVETIEQGLQMLLKSRVDYALSDSVSFAYLQERNPDYQELKLANTAIMTTQLMVDVNESCAHVEQLARLLGEQSS